MCLWVTYKKKREKICNLKVELDLDPLVRGTNPRIRIRAKISRIPNTGFSYPGIATIIKVCKRKILGPDPQHWVFVKSFQGLYE